MLIMLSGSLDRPFFADRREPLWDKTLACKDCVLMAPAYHAREAFSA